MKHSIVLRTPQPLIRLTNGTILKCASSKTNISAMVHDTVTYIECGHFLEEALLQNDMEMKSSGHTIRKLWIEFILLKKITTYWNGRSSRLPAWS